MKRCLLFLLACSIFSRKIFALSILGFDIDVFAYSVYFMLFIFVGVFIGYSKRLVFITSLVFLIGLIFSIKSNGDLKVFFKTAFPLIITVNGILPILSVENIKLIWNYIFRIGFIVAVLGIFQVVLKVFGLYAYSPYSNFDLHSILYEPSHYVIVMFPIFFFGYINNENKIKLIIYFVSLILTFKLTLYLSLFFVLLFHLGGLMRIVALVISMMVLFNIIYNIPDYYFRLAPILNYFSNGVIDSDVQVLHGTPLSFLSNVEVALNNSIKNFGLGVGLGGHESSYHEYFKRNAWLGVSEQYGLNVASGHSLGIRVISEFGLVGCMFLVYQVFLLLVRIKQDNWLKIHALPAILYFVLRIFKLGSYIDYGAPIFLCIVLYFVFGKSQQRRFHTNIY
jgi:hypothetical protein